MSYAEKRDSKLTGKWWAEVDLRHKGGVRFKRAFDRKADADAYEAYVKLSGQEPPGLGGPVTGHTFASVAAEAKDAGGKKGAWKRGRDRSIIQRLDTLCAMPLGRLPIERVGYSALLDVVRDLEKRPGQRAGKKLSVGTINRYLTAASAVLTFAEKTGRIERKPEVPWQDEPKQGRFHWLAAGREHAVANALRAAGHDDAAFCTLILVATGMRWGEFAGLEPGQIEDDCVRLWKTKTKTPRRIPIAVDLARELRAFVAAGRIPKYITFSKHFGQAVKACGENPELTIHCLRHTACTRLILKGWPMLKVKRFLGHRKTETTERYFHMLDTDLDDAPEILSPLAGNEPQNATGAEIVSLATNRQKVA